MTCYYCTKPLNKNEYNSKSIGGQDICKGMTAPEQRRLTNKELSEWIAKGNGQGRVKGTNTANTFYMYDSNEDSEPVPTSIEVRTWDGEWHEPTADYCTFATFTEESK